MVVGFDVAKDANVLVDDDGKPSRTGTVWTAAAHVITAVIGSGVLSLAWSMAQLGWIIGPIFMIGFAIVTYYGSYLLAECYRSPDGSRNYTYKYAVLTYLGRKSYIACAAVQYMNLVGSAIGYTITASISMVAIARSNCFHKHGRDWHHHCAISNNPYMICFGVLQIFFSLIPTLHEIWWLSIVAAVMSFAYSTIGLGLSFAKTIGKSIDGHHHSYGTLEGVSIMGAFKDTSKTWTFFQALGNIAFAYAFSQLLIEIQDTIRMKAPPNEERVMKRSTSIGIGITTLFYMSVGFVGYAAFGNHAPGNLLTGFGFYNPFWLVDIANLCIVIHLVGAYQIFAQPIFAVVEDACSNNKSKKSWLHKKIPFKIPLIGTLEITIFSVVWRSVFVVFTTTVAMALPFFNDIVGILGSLIFFPLTVYFPIQMSIARKKIPSWSLKWVLLMTLCFIAFIISVVGLVGSVASVIIDLHHYKPFKTKY